MHLPETFLNRMQQQLNSEQYKAYLSAMEQPCRRAMRINTLKISIQDFLSLNPSVTEPDGIIPEGFLIPEDYPVGDNPYHAAGLFYMQEPSAQFPVSLLDPKPGETVLDLCAAPGGKSGQIAAAMQNTGLLISNEINTKRSTVLAGNLERLGVRNAVITDMRPDALCPLLSDACDAVLVDAPCSGEGMFRRDPQAVLEWSPAHVAACAERQTDILQHASSCVRKGGRLVYSTCTFSEEENESVIRSFLANNPDFSLIRSERLYPFSCQGEGQFAALLSRSGSIEKESVGRIPARPDKCPDPLAELLSIPSDSFSCSVLPDGRVFLLPEFLPEKMSQMHVLRAGISAGNLVKNRFEPSHGLFLAFPSGDFRRSVTLASPDLKRFLAGETVPCPSGVPGYTAVCVDDFPVGFGKSDGKIIKNHIPKGLRIRKY